MWQSSGWPCARETGRNDEHVSWSARLASNGVCIGRRNWPPGNGLRWWHSTPKPRAGAWCAAQA